MRTILNACQNEMCGIVAYTYPNVCEKNTSFCLVLKKMHTKENWFLFASRCIWTNALLFYFISQWYARMLNLQIQFGARI